MIHTSMLDIATGGGVCSQCHGLDHTRLKELLGPPSDWGMQNLAENAEIWRYGDLEFHFSDWTVFQIFSDHNELTDGGDALSIDPWVIRRGLGRDEFEATLTDAGIPFETTTPDYGSSQRLVRTKSGAVFTFCEGSNHDESGLVAWSIRTGAEQVAADQCTARTLSPKK